MAYVRECTSAAFNTGQSSCPVPRGKIKGLIFTQRGYTLPESLTAENIEIAEHADRPNRIYPVKTVEEYAPSGGEAQFSQQGYGANNLTSYSALQETYTLDARDMGLVANLVKAKSAQLDVYLINDSNVIFGEEDSDGNFVGIPLSSVAIGGQQFDSSGQVANMTIILNYKDVEQHWKREAVREVDFDIVSMMQGLVDVAFVTSGTGYKLVEKFGGLDVTAYYGSKIATNAATAMPNATAVSYSEADEIIALTGTPALAAPSILQTVGVTGIQQS